MLHQMMMLFAAVHESAIGTKRTPRDDLLFVRFRGKADIHDRVASTAPVVDHQSGPQFMSAR